jgi:hypothetical protein
MSITATGSRTRLDIGQTLQEVLNVLTVAIAAVQDGLSSLLPKILVGTLIEPFPTVSVDLTLASSPRSSTGGSAAPPRVSRPRPSPRSSPRPYPLSCLSTRRRPSRARASSRWRRAA